MHCHILYVSQKIPDWCQKACDTYLMRLQRFMKCTTTTIPTEKRHKNNISTCIQEEGEKILKKIKSDQHVIALDEHGQAWSTLQFASKLTEFQSFGRDLVFIIGGPDGLAKACLARANQVWSLSNLTFPHHLAQVILLEQLYRAGCLLANHPYHRE